MRSLSKTNDGFAPTLARLTLGIVIFLHAAQKAPGLFGGYGFHGKMNWFTQQLHISAALAICLALIVMIHGTGRLSVEACLAGRPPNKCLPEASSPPERQSKRESQK
jgi:hypothetical protein